MERTKKYQWHKVAEHIGEINFSPNGITEITVGTKTICIALHDNSLNACIQKCPHAGGIIADGFIDILNNVVCPLHRYKYNLQNGRNVSGEGYYLKTYPLVHQDDGVYVGIEATSFLNLF